jgi:hypothetical protein
MLALLSAPRGRVSAARLAARAAGRGADPEAYGIIIRMPRVPADAEPARVLTALPQTGGDR